MNVDSAADPRLEEIAERLLAVPTLRSRHSDSLDFHQVAVWQLRAALAEARELGWREGTNAADRVMDRWDRQDHRVR